ncbi:MAG TPA: hypothetical protein VKN63_09280 [Afifellaceae bacterium]|nr:hypothetical protein [Afifellaceae bacterium]
MIRKMLFALLACLFVSATASSDAFAAGYDFAALAEPNYRVPLRSFPECCAHPAWFTKTDAQQIRSIGDLYKIWQDRSIANQKKAKSFFQAIHAFHQTNDEISAAAISLYPNVDRKYPELIPLLEYGVGKYFHYDNTGDFYKGSPGDRSAGLVRHLARQYQNAGRDTDAVNVMAIYMAVREADTNGHLQQLLSLEMAKSLDAMGQPAQADRLLSYALSTYQGSWNEKIIAQRSALRQKLGLFERLPAATLYIAAAALLFLLAGAFQFVRRRTA